MRAPQRSILVLSAASFFSMMGMSIVSPVLPDYALSFGVPFALAGLLISGFGLARLFIDIPAGMLSERFGAKRFMLLGLAIIAVSSLIAGFAGNYAVLLAARVLEGAGSAIYTTTSLTAVSRLSPKEKRGINLSLYTSMFLIGTMIGPVVGGLAAEHFGLGAPFTVYGLFASFSFVLVWKTIGKEEVVDPSSAIRPRELLSILR
ncbi:MAG TPA: MFS transporter, partial [Methanomassiliicoccaceae archaeon]|nr:MFS transporter [Methanomassiliicoccaceae archaeon]